MSATEPSQRGRFITLEGGEGAGKTTLARGLAAALEAKGVHALLTREPGGSPGADEIRDLIVRGGPGRWTPLTDVLLISAARADHVARTIAPALADGRWVICDRYIDSSRAYQGAGAGLDSGVLDALEQLAAFPAPDLTFVLDVDPASGVGRSRGAALGEDRFEKMGAGFHARVREAFLDIAAREPKRCVVIDASSPKEAVLAAALAAISSRLGLAA
ncbi:MAG: dTMP kinase [Hyphomonadaceae bacterium]